MMTTEKLFISAVNGLKYEVIEFILKNDPNEELKNILLNNININNLVSNNYYGITGLSEICLKGYHRILKIILPILTRSELGIKNSKSNTLLHKACLGNQKECVKLLLPYYNKYEITLVNSGNKTPYDLTTSLEIKDLINDRLLELEEEEKKKNEEVVITISKNTKRIIIKLN
jgi:ankyrin repeat protein